MLGVPQSLVSLGDFAMASKVCPYGGVCHRVSCDELSMDGSVVVCERHRNRNGLFMRRRVGVCVVSIFCLSKVKRKRVDGGS